MGNNEETWMTDQFGRDITYLRISVTELCNLRCRYCMPEEGVCKKSHADMLTEDEMIQAVTAAASLGITNQRITDFKDPDAVEVMFTQETAYSNDFTDHGSCNSVNYLSF